MRRARALTAGPSATQGPSRFHFGLNALGHEALTETLELSIGGFEGSGAWPQLHLVCAALPVGARRNPTEFRIGLPHVLAGLCLAVLLVARTVRHPWGFTNMLQRCRYQFGGYPADMAEGMQLFVWIPCGADSWQSCMYSGKLRQRTSPR